MTFQKLLLATALFCAGAAHGTVTPEQKATLEQVNAALEQIKNNARLSSENEELFSSIAQALNYSPIQVQKISPVLIALSPFYQTQVYSPECDTLNINEEWLNSMPLQERTYTIGKSLWTIREMGSAYAEHYSNTAQALSTKKEFLKGMLAAGLGLSLYFWSRPSLIKASIAGIIALSVVDTFIIDPFFVSLEQKKLDNIDHEADEHIVRTLHCLDGALAVLRKERSSIEESCDKDALLKNEAYNVLNRRIAYLEALKST